VKQKTLLLVEDEFLIAASKRLELERYGYKVVPAHTGEAAVEMIGRHEDIELVLMDIDLGDGIDGTEAALRILRIKDLPIVFLSNHTEHEIVSKSENITSYGYIVKNSGITVLNASIKMAFKLFDAKVKEKEKSEALLESERRLIENEAKYSSVFSESPFPIMIIDTEDGTFSDVNEAFVRGSEYSREELIGGNAVRLGIISGESVREAQRLIAATGKFVDREIAIRTKSGKTRIALSTGSIIDVNRHKYILQSILDITERKNIEERLVTSEFKYRSLIEFSSDIVFTVDRSGTYQYANSAFASAFGKEPEYFVGKTFWDLYPKKNADERFRIIERVFQSGEKESFEIEVPLGARALLFSSTANPIKDEHGNTILVLTHGTDITERKLADERIKSLLGENELILKEVHHRIKNNMNTMRSLVSLQGQFQQDKNAKNALLDVESRFNSMLVLYEKLNQAPGLESISVASYLPSLIEEVISPFPNRSVVRVATHIDDFAIGAKQLQTLGIIINEVLTNIMKYAFAGRASGTITIDAGKTDGIIRISIRDDGVGLPEGIDFEHSPGFGLMLIRELTRQIDGKIRAERGNGTKVILELMS
jgi:PAS domain S-box-containing protein